MAAALRGVALAALGALVSCSADQECSQVRDVSNASAPDDGGDEGFLPSVQLIQHDLRISKVANQAAPALLAHGKAGLPARAASTAAAAETTTTPSPTGVTLNAEGDLAAFMSALVVNIGGGLFCIGVFCVLRQRYPLMYCNNVIQKFAPTSPPNTMFGWVRPTLRITPPQIAKSITMDHAMMIEFTNLCMKIMTVIGLPMFFIIGPMNWIFGGNAAGEDRLSYLSFGNVQDGSQLFWIHAFVIWGVVLVVKMFIFNAQRSFLPMRFEWLRNMHAERANTVLVESIPDKYQSDGALMEFFHEMMPHARLTGSYVARDTSTLQPLVAAHDKAKQSLRKAEAQWEKAGKDVACRPKIRESLLGAKVDAIQFYEKQLRELEPQVSNERKRIELEAKTVGGVNTSSGFITFAKRSDAELALRLSGISANQDEWELYTPPEPTDVLWNDLTQDDSLQVVRAFVGYALIAGLYFIYMPLIIGVTNIAKLVNLGPFQPIWQGFAPTVGLQFMVAFLPTFLLAIFTNFFTLKANAWAQHQLQIWYFWFQVVFVILATAVGQDVNDFTQTLATQPFEIFTLLAKTMPYATHFYMNFLCLQFMTHSMNMMRYFPLIKYKIALGLFSEEEAREMAEPEDQDYYGIGSRSARWTIFMSVGIVYGTLSPPITMLTLMNFAVTRLVYGYLFCFAETRKTDTGGAFFVKQLQHLFVALLIYCVLMTGVLLIRASSYGPGIIVAPTLAYVAWALFRFNTEFCWERLPYEELVLHSHDPDVKKEVESFAYVQPEMVQD